VSTHNRTHLPWKRRFLTYVSEASHDFPPVGSMPGNRITYTTKLFFITYWLIFWIHGGRQLDEQHAKIILRRELS
jgi:hypothetical protein